MNIAPLQPKGIVFQEVSVQANLDEHENPMPTENFDFSGVRISCEVGHGDVERADGEELESSSSMLVSIKFSILNTEGKKAPYNVKVVATGIFTWIGKETAAEERRDLTVVNGASILFGAIREMVLNVTSRSMSGTMLLPSFNFLDNKPSIIEAKAKADKPAEDKPLGEQGHQNLKRPGPSRA